MVCVWLGDPMLADGPAAVCAHCCALGLPVGLGAHLEQQ